MRLLFKHILITICTLPGYYVFLSFAYFAIRMPFFLIWKSSLSIIMAFLFCHVYCRHFSQYVIICLLFCIYGNFTQRYLLILFLVIYSFACSALSSLKTASLTMMMIDNLASELVSYCSCNKLPHNWCLKITHLLFYGSGTQKSKMGLTIKLN